MNNARSIRSMADERLDFNHFGQLRKSYIVAASYRCGSTYLCAKLWQTGLLGAPNEVLNPTFQLPVLMTRLRASSLSDYIAKLLARRTSRNGVFGLKAHFRHFQLFMKAYPELLEVLSPVTYIHVTRQDKIAQAVSAAKAWQTHYWNTLVQVGSPPRACYDRNLIENCLRDIDEQERAWRHWFGTCGIAPFEVSYEDFSANLEHTVRSIAVLLEVVDDESDEVNIPITNKQSDDTNREWIERFRRDTRRGRQCSTFSANDPIHKRNNHELRVETQFPQPHFFHRYDKLIERLLEEPTPDPPFIERIRLQRRYRAIIAHNKRLFQNARVLDVGSSIGFWSLAALDAGAAYVVGLETSSKLIKKSEENLSAYNVLGDRYRFIRSEVLAALKNFEPEQFDVVLCAESFEFCYFPEIFHALAQLWPKYVVIDTKISHGYGPLARFGITIDREKVRITSVPSHELIVQLCQPAFRWRLIDWRGMGIGVWTGVHDYARDVRRTYMLDRQ